jgi:hypothetical protein
MILSPEIPRERQSQGSIGSLGCNQLRNKLTDHALQIGIRRQTQRLHCGEKILTGKLAHPWNRVVESAELVQ